MDSDTAELMIKKLDELDGMLTAAESEKEEEEDMPPLDAPPKDAKKGRKARKSRKAGLDEEDDMDEEDDDDEEFKIAKKGKKAKKAMSDGGDDKDEKIASLSAALNRAVSHITIMKAKPMVDQMLAARASAGMPEKQLSAFRGKLQNMSYDEIKDRFSEDSALYNMPAPQTENESLYASLPFNGSPAQAAEGKTLEEMFD